MPNFDGGHYFLTVLAPVRMDTMIDPIIGRSRSHRALLAQKLALLPTGRQTAASPADAWPSPFARNTLNHLARFAIIDNPNFNGRVSGDSLVALAQNVNPLQPQPVDRLGSPFLLFAADIDAPGDGKTALRAYTDSLWATMKGDLSDIFGHCFGFEAVDSAEAFHSYICRCQVETTMPFNDYWAYGLQVHSPALPTGALKAAGIAAIAALGVWLIALLLHIGCTLLGLSGEVAAIAAKISAWGTIVVPILFAALFAAIYGLYLWILKRGKTPFPTAPDCDLPSVLKGLFLQQHFTRFAIETQGLGDDALYARFAAFADTVKPSETTPTQIQGDVSAKALEWAR